MILSHVQFHGSFQGAGASTSTSSAPRDTHAAQPASASAFAESLRSVSRQLDARQTNGPRALEWTGGGQRDRLGAHGHQMRSSEARSSRSAERVADRVADRQARAQGGTSRASSGSDVRSTDEHRQRPARQSATSEATRADDKQSRRAANSENRAPDSDVVRSVRRDADAEPAEGRAETHIDKDMDEGAAILDLAADVLAKLADKLERGAMAHAANRHGGGGTGVTGQLQSLVHQIQHAMTGGTGGIGAAGGFADAQGEGVLAKLGNSGEASTSNGQGQSQSGGQHGGTTPSLMALAQFLNEGPAQQAGASNPVFSLAAANASANGASGVNGLLEGMQPMPGNSSGDGNASSARATGAGQAQSQGGPGAQGPLSDLNATRLARGLQNAVQQRGGAVTLRLTPPEMGTVRIQLDIQGTRVNAQFHAQTESARQMLTQQLSQLRQALEGQGLTVDRLSAQTMSPSTAQAGSQQAQQQGSHHAHGGASEQGADGSPHDGRSRGEYGRGQASAELTDQDGDGAGGGSMEAVFEQVLNEMG